MQKPSIYVVKFGGSLFNGGRLGDWIHHLNRWAQGKCVILVPGGGEFANIIRRLQAACQMHDEIAHELALGAMRQSGEIISRLCERAPSFKSLRQLESMVDDNGIYLWVPSSEEFRATNMPRNWSVTSDSIALWMAIRLGAVELILLKSVNPPPTDIDAWAESDFVDDYFSSLVTDLSCDIRTASHYRDLSSG